MLWHATEPFILSCTHLAGLSSFRAGYVYILRTTAVGGNAHRDVGRPFVSPRLVAFLQPTRSSSRRVAGRSTMTYFTSSAYILSYGKVHSMLIRIVQNTQSGTQWDGLKHFGLLEHGVFYQKRENLSGRDICRVTDLILLSARLPASSRQGRSRYPTRPTSTPNSSSSASTVRRAAPSH